MKNFIFNAYTEMIFGKGQIDKLPERLIEYGNNVLLVYGGGSIKNNGIYDKVINLLSEFNVYELAGVEPNPKIESVRRGVEICRDNKVDVVLAVGGGSTIDCAKVIAGAVDYDGDAWDIVVDSSKIDKVLPIVTVLTLAATGSEMNKNAVISNMEINEKVGTSSKKFIPRVSILDPEYTFAVPRNQTAAGTADIMSHVFENYFSLEKGTFIQDRFCEGIIQTCIKYCPRAIENPCDYNARANLMWASSMALNGLCGAGKNSVWVCHPIEHQLSAYYDITHGVGLAIITPHWMRYALNEKTLKKFVIYANNVWNIQGDDLYEVANKGIDLTEEFFTKKCAIPSKLSQLGITDEYFQEMAEKAVQQGRLNYADVPLEEADVVNILNKAL